MFCSVKHRRASVRYIALQYYKGTFDNKTTPIPRGLLSCLTTLHFPVRRKASVEARLAGLALETATEHHAVTSNPSEPTTAAQAPPTVATHRTVDLPASLTLPSVGALDGQNPEDFIGRTLICHEEDELPYRYTVVDRCHSYARQTDYFVLRSDDGLDEWELTPEEMRLNLKKSTLA